MNKIPNRAAICEVLMEEAKADKDIVVLCSDSRGSASLSPFADAYPNQFVEVGIAEQNLVSISAGLAKCGKKPYAASPASFLSTRSYEQAKVDVAYSNTNVKLIGISGGVSYGALGMRHHSAQDIAAMSAIPNMRVYLPSDRHQTRKLTQALLQDQKPAEIRVGRNPVE
ncbi:MAG: transketolase family protein, partial [Lachnospiraceae bacterium]|nr:transketolase family protein [Lachnospiraceae bacterium]